MGKSQQHSSMAMVWNIAWPSIAKSEVYSRKTEDKSEGMTLGK
jgi:hypothetical protein